MTPSAKAQTIRSDASNFTTVTTTDATVGRERFLIEDGRSAGNNLFHSFDAFSIPDGGTATFASTASILNIIGRVTGSEPSNINGTLQSQTPVNFFFINPNGIVFGPNAALSIGGSFIGSTAESVLFPGDQTFSASDISSTPTLSISAPEGLQMGTASGNIQVNDIGYTALVGIPLTIDSSSSLRLDGGQTLALIGNGLSFQGGTLAAPGGQIALGSVESGTVKLSQSNLWVPDYEDVSTFADITLTRRSLINVSNVLFDSIGQPTPLGISGGNIHIHSQNFSAVDSSLALIQNYSPLPSGSIYVNARGDLSLSQADTTDPRRLVGSGFTTNAFDAGAGGNIEIATGGLLYLENDGFITTETFGLAPGGNIILREVSDITLIENQIAATDLGGIHTISFSPPVPEPFSPGTAGNIEIVTGSLNILEDGISSQAINAGDSGSVTVTADDISIYNSGTISSATLGTGNSGNLNVTAKDILVSGFHPATLFPSGILATTVADGNAGNLVVNAERLSILEGGRVDSSTISRGDAGTVTINASEDVLVSGN
ncbi:MAG: filamentous hemagglutinin N-terminal domain-containing protein, partial [Cyanobacteria bacterium J06632_3]